MLVRGGGEVTQSIEAAADALVAATGPCMMEQGAPVHAGLERLLRGEVACLRLGEPIQTVVVDLVRHMRDIIP